MVHDAHRSGMRSSVDYTLNDVVGASSTWSLPTCLCHHDGRAKAAPRTQEQQQRPRKAQQQQQMQRQHLVEFQGRTLCVSSLPKISCVLAAVLETLGVPPGASARMEVPWRITWGGRFLGLAEEAPSSGSILRVWTGGLRGGKGGFGAMLRAMAKQVTDTSNWRL